MAGISDDSENMNYLNQEAQTHIGQGLSFLEMLVKDSMEGTVQVRMLRIILENMKQFLSLTKLLTIQSGCSYQEDLKMVMDRRNEELKEYKIKKDLLHNFVQNCHRLGPGKESFSWSTVTTSAIYGTVVLSLLYCLLPNPQVS